MPSILRLVGLAVCGTLILATGSSAESPEVGTLLEEIKSVWKPPAFDQSKRGDPDYVRDYERRLRESLDRRVDLTGEFYRVAPGHPLAREFMMKRWSAMMHPLMAHRREELLAEVRMIAEKEGHPLRRDAAWYKASLGIAAAREGGPDAALGPIEAFIALAPGDERGAQLLLRVARLPNTPPDRRSSLIDRILKEYPDSMAARNIERSRHRAESIGKPFELEFQDITSGKAVSVQKDLRGKVVVVEFWATWCGPCVAELPKLKELYAKYRDRGVQFIGVSLDSADEQGRKAVESFIEKNRIDWPQFHGAGESGKFAESWGIEGIPTVFVIDTEGKLHSTEARGRLESLVPELLKAGDASDGKGVKP